MTGNDSCTLVIPVYNNEGSIRRLLTAVAGIAAQVGAPFEAVFVVDGSPDGSYAALVEGLPRAAFRSRLILLSRNFGSFAAIRAGLAAGSGAHFAVMAADLQDPPDTIVRFFAELRAGACDVVVGRRTARADPWSTRLASAAFWALFRRLVNDEVPSGGVDIFGCTRLARDQLLALGESNSSLIALLYWIGFKRREISYERAPRLEGQSGWSFKRKRKYLADSIFTFSSLPITVFTWLGALGLVVSGGFSVVVLAARLVGSIEVPGYATSVLLIAFFAALNLLGLGVIGSYVWRIFENTKGRPHAIAMKELAFAGGDAP